MARAEPKNLDFATKIDPIRCRFVKLPLEREYEKFAFARNIATNKLGILIGVPLFSLYAALDFANLSEPQSAIFVRAAAAFAAFIILFSLRFQMAAHNHEWLTACVVGILSAAMILIIANEPSLDNAYYVGLIQAAVILSFLLRMKFEIAITTLALMLVGFSLAVSGKDTKEAYLQTLILVTMFSICGFGIYLSERFRRTDFLKTRTIEKQNDQLNKMLANVQLDNARKVAAMNLLVHFVRTPVHQIVGFTDVISQSLSDEGRQAPNDCLEGVRIIKAASRELSRNVTHLLTYYRLDEKANEEVVLIDVDSLMRDYAEHFPSDIEVAVDCEKVAIYNRPSIVSAALSAVVARYGEHGVAAKKVQLTLKRERASARLTICDDGAMLGADEFLGLMRPLDKVDHYLTANGSSMPMALRTVARAVQLCSGDFGHRIADGLNVFSFSLADFEANRAEETTAA